MFSAAQELVIARYKQPQHAGFLENADLVFEGANPFCGDEIKISLKLKENKTIQAIKHQSRACAICSASTDLLAETLTGESLEKIHLISSTDIQQLIGIPLSPLRLKCALLPLETLQINIPA